MYSPIVYVLGFQTASDDFHISMDGDGSRFHHVFFVIGGDGHVIGRWRTVVDHMTLDQLTSCRVT